MKTLKILLILAVATTYGCLSSCVGLGISASYEKDGHIYEASVTPTK